MNPNYRAYHRENFKEQMKNKQNRRLVAKWNKIVRATMNVEGATDNTSGVERTLTDYLVGDKDLQRCLLGVQFTEKTEVHTNNAILDISSTCKYVNEPLAKKYGIREEDLVAIECKNIYTFSSMTLNQKRGAFVGSLHCVIAYGGSNEEYVKGTDCPVISTSKIPENINPKYFSIYDDGIEEGLLQMVKTCVCNNPLYFSNQGIINNYVEGLLREIDIRRHRNIYEIIFNLGKRDKTRTIKSKETKGNFVNRVEKLVVDSMQTEKMLSLDMAYPSLPENRRARYVTRSFNGKVQYTPESGNDIFSAMELPPVWGKNELYRVDKFNPLTDNEFTVHIDKDIASRLNIKSKVKFIKDTNSSYAQFAPSFYPRVETAKTLSPFMRQEIQKMFAELYPYKALLLDKKRKEISDILQESKSIALGDSVEKIKVNMITHRSIMDVEPPR